MPERQRKSPKDVRKPRSISVSENEWQEIAKAAGEVPVSRFLISAALARARAGATKEAPSTEPSTP